MSGDRPRRRLPLRECCAWHRCRGPLQARRATRRFCSVRCRVASHRARHGAAQLRQCTVEPLARDEAVAFILRYELLGTVGNVRLFFGLRAPNGMLLAAVGFGHGPHAAGADVVLQRGGCRRAPPYNARRPS